MDKSLNHSSEAVQGKSRTWSTDKKHSFLTVDSSGNKHTFWEKVIALTKPRGLGDRYRIDKNRMLPGRALARRRCIALTLEQEKMRQRLPSRSGGSADNNFIRLKKNGATDFHLGSPCGIPAVTNGSRDTQHLHAQ
ncbi:MAG: hypothetical protein IPP59_14905 [Betaproteobacteria bacterium]|nr:hypothetical protein [Candidatus Dechloromonas phosphorivorans]